MMFAVIPGHNGAFQRPFWNLHWMPFGTIPEGRRCDDDPLGAHSISNSVLGSAASPALSHAIAPNAIGATKTFHNARLHQLLAKSPLLRAMSLGLLARLELALLTGHKEASVISTLKAARKGRESLLSGNEAFTVYSIARAQAALNGDMAEVGVYQGCSAKIISTANGGAPLHLFDTFAGLPQPVGAENDQLHEGLYAASLASVQSFLADHDNLSFYPGLFPMTAEPCADKRFSFVHLDVDLKSSTLGCLNFFYPRMVPGGVILSHDYSYLDGVRSAFTDFLATRPERVIELPTSQVMVVKLG